jgi:hypothetical protein
MQRTISVCVGKGSVNHNSRNFKTDNVDPNRSHLNIDYCNDRIEKVYHELFDEAQKKYNAKQTRSDRIIKNYYKKICSGEQEKPFHEIILQVGDMENMSSVGENAELARTVLDEYYRGFQERNPPLRVFSAHLHMDEATPHLHIDFVPYTTGSSRGLETRVSLKQALAALGFKGGTRRDTEWSQWVQSEKEQLAKVMERHGIEWEQKGTHEVHKTVSAFKLREKAKELEALEAKIADKTKELKSVAQRVNDYENSEKGITKFSDSIENDPEYQLPEPQGLMSAKSYKTKFADPVIQKLKSLVKSVMVRFFNMRDNYNRLNRYNGQLYSENEHLRSNNDTLKSENYKLKQQNMDYKMLRKFFGNGAIDKLLEQAKQPKQREKRLRNKNYFER